MGESGKQPAERKIRVHCQTRMLALCQVQAKSCQNQHFPGKCSVLSHKQEKDISQILFFYPQEKNTFYLSPTKNIILK